ncbi:MAG: hypothetical protein AB8B58_12970 [Roseobacter sp.]
MSAAPAAFVEKLAALPEGSFTAQAHGQKYIVTKASFSQGRSIKLVAEELCGTDYISLNLYDLSKGAQVYPCEMPLAKVLAFVQELSLAQDAG